MFIRIIIIFFYLAITLIAFISPSRFGIVDYLPGLFLMWFFFLAFYLGTRSIVVIPDNLVIQNANKYVLLGVTVIYPIFYDFYVKFYTDLSLAAAAGNLFSGVSNYYIYQTFFNESELNVFSFSKLPYILGHGLLKFIFFYFAIKVFAYSLKPSKLEIFCLIVMSLVIALVAIARGTSIEFFELFFMFLYIYLLRNNLFRKQHVISKSAAIKIIAIVLMLIVYFIINIQIRMGENFDFTEIPDFNKDSFLYRYFPSFSLLIFSLNDYFLFGIQYSSIIYVNLFQSIPGTISTFIPHGIRIFGIDSDYREFAQNYIAMGAKWNPDMSIYLDKYGSIITILTIFFLGFITRTVYKKRFWNVYSSIIVFYVMFFMISFPVGNFFSNSSSTIIALMIASGLYLKKVIKLR